MPKVPTAPPVIDAPPAEFPEMMPRITFPVLRDNTFAPAELILGRDPPVAGSGPASAGHVTLALEEALNNPVAPCPTTR
jgi:hypothetical protein